MSKWWKLIKNGEVVATVCSEKEPGEEQGIDFERAVQVDRAGDPYAETWTEKQGYTDTNGNDFSFKRDLDNAAEAALNPRPAIASIHQAQAEEAKRWLEGDREGAFPHLSAQSEFMDQTKDDRAEAIVTAIDKASSDNRTVKINTKRLMAKNDLRAVNTVAEKTEIVLAFKAWLQTVDSVESN